MIFLLRRYSWEDQHYLLYCYNGGFNFEKSIQSMKLHLEWLNTPKWHTVTDKVIQIWVDFL